MRDEERLLIRGLASGDAAAEDKFVSVWSPRIHKWINQRASDESADDYAQEVWSHLLEDDCRRLLQWKGLYDDHAWHANSLRAFLKTLTVHKVFDLQQADRPYRTPATNPRDILDDWSVGADPASEAERDRLTIALEYCMQHFKPRDHRLVEMWWEGHVDAHIAAELAMTRNNVYQRRFYLFNQLRECLRDKLPEYFRHA